jgi:hypothetical protein
LYDCVRRNSHGGGMFFDRVEGRSTRRALGKPLSHRSAYLVIATVSILGWAIFILAGIAVVRLIGFL